VLEMAGGRAATVLRGRSEECGVLDRLLDGARTGQSSALVIRGEAGVGKTALLDYVAEEASGVRLARVAGVESEMGFAFAGLLQLLGGAMLERVEQLAGPQRDALRRAFGLIEGPPPELFLVSLAALNLLSQVSEERPLVCLVDDANGWTGSPLPPCPSLPAGSLPSRSRCCSGCDNRVLSSSSTACRSSCSRASSLASRSRGCQPRRGRRHRARALGLAGGGARRRRRGGRVPRARGRAQP
jgi:hypothetical protein